MPAVPEQAHVLERLSGLGKEQRSIRAVVLTSTRAKPDAPVDVLSDYDVILFVTEADAFSRDDAWQSAYGRPLVRWGDQKQLHGLTIYFRGVVYDNGVKIDYSIWPEALLELIAAHPRLPDGLDVGYRVLLDKDGRTAAWPQPTHQAHIPAKPTNAEYHALVEEFWWSTTYVAKSLWRREVVHAKFTLDNDAKFVALRRFLEWRIEIDHDWSLKPGAYGRGLERLLPADIWTELASTYVGTDIEENWKALFCTTALFRRVATEVGVALGYAYPRELDAAMTAHLERVRKLPVQGRAASG